MAKNYLFDYSEQLATENVQKSMWQNQADAHCKLQNFEKCKLEFAEEV